MLPTELQLTSLVWPVGRPLENEPRILAVAPRKRRIVPRGYTTQIGLWSSAQSDPIPAPLKLVFATF